MSLLMGGGGGGVNDDDGEALTAEASVDEPVCARVRARRQLESTLRMCSSNDQEGSCFRPETPAGAA